MRSSDQERSLSQSDAGLGSFFGALVPPDIKYLHSSCKGEGGVSEKVKERGMIEGE